MQTQYKIDFIEIYTPLANVLAYWHTEALGFTLTAVMDQESGGKQGIASYVLESDQVRLVLTSTYPPYLAANSEVSSFITKYYCGVKRVALQVADVKKAFQESIDGGGIPMKMPAVTEDENGEIEEAAIRLYDDCEITFINRENYTGAFKPGYRSNAGKKQPAFLRSVDHVASELRINEGRYWTDYLSNAIGTQLVQSIEKGPDNKTGMILHINQSPDKNLTLVIAEPESISGRSKVQKNIDLYGACIHHLAFATDDLISTTLALQERKVAFVSFPASYYDLLRADPDFSAFDIDKLQELNILCDKEEDTYLLQKFIKPISDRPFFIYEIVQRVNGYNGFALKNINVLKKAEEMEIMKTTTEKV